MTYMPSGIKRYYNLDIDELQISEYYNAKIDELKNPNVRHGYIFKWLDKVISPGMKVLDVGCGTGITSRYMQDIGAKVVGVDIADELIGYAREQESYNIEYIVKDCINMQLGEVFDAIVIIDCIEHLPRHMINHFTKNLSNHVHENTLIYVNLPDGRFLNKLKEYYPAKAQIIDESYYPHQVLDLFKRIKFEVVQSELYGIFPKIH